MANTRNISIENAKIFWKNFTGKEGKFNPEGQRNFCVVIDPFLANQLLQDGWNVKTLQPRDETEQPKSYIQVKVSFKNQPPKIALVSSKGISLLTEETVGMLDWADLENVDLIISPYHWEVSGRTGVTAYLKTIYATIAEDEFESKYYPSQDSARDAIGGCGRCEECDGYCGGGM